jgi:hypothetical protein
MRLTLANFFRTIFGASSTEKALQDLANDIQICLESRTAQIISLEIEVINLKNLLYKPNEKIVDIRELLLTAIISCQGKPHIYVDASGEEVFAGFSQPNIKEIQQKIEKALSACDIAIKEQMKGTDGP